MKILHTADLHLGQVIYQNYERSDEHLHYFTQLRDWCAKYSPDALLLCGDIFDIQQPSASTKKAFNDAFAGLHREFPDIAVVIVAGNHDSASRIHADNAVWALSGIRLVGAPPPQNPEAGWQENYIVRLDAGYIVALPYMAGERADAVQALLDYVARENRDGKPVVMTGHAAVDGLDHEGHDPEVGNMKIVPPESFGTGYDYLALGHIHKPQTIGHREDISVMEPVTYPSPVIRYSGSALHVSCDEAYPHSVSLVEIGSRGGDVTVEQLRIDELRHFYVLPHDSSSSFKSAEEAIKAVTSFRDEGKEGYIRLRVDYAADLPTNFNQQIYDIISIAGEKIRYNPKIIWNGAPAGGSAETVRPVFEVAELQQMTSPLTFIEKTIDQYPSLSMNELREAFDEVEKEIIRMNEEKEARERAPKTKKAAAAQAEE